jgi:elongator complex protein 3
MVDCLKDNWQEYPRRATPRKSHLFDAENYRAELIAIIREIALAELPERSKILDTQVLNAILRRYPRDGKGLFSRSQLIKGFRRFSAETSFGLSEQQFVERVQLRPVRTLSGVTPITVFTAPYPCPGSCVFCPNDVRVPKSYLADEPVSQRAIDSGFDPYLQTWNRLSVYRAIGHPTDKVELIISGGTWSYYPETYQIWFIYRCFKAMNEFGRGIDKRDQSETLDRVLPYQESETLFTTRSSYNRKLLARESQEAQKSKAATSFLGTWDGLRSEQRENESGNCRCVGLSVETRPDYISESEVIRLRRLGCTKVQIGCQSLSDRILAVNQRGHDVDTTRRAVKLLRRGGFKILLHWMANLLGATPEDDTRDFSRLFDDADFRPDELKIYPCSLVENTALMQCYNNGEWRPYSHDELLDILKTALNTTPCYCRLSRVIRDIGSDDIVVGNKNSNLREVAERALRAEGRSIREIRGREIRERQFDVESLQLRMIDYQTSIGDECFIEFATKEDRLAGFLRLALPKDDGFIEEIRGCAIIREIRVYGASLSLGEHTDSVAQHRGLGQRLIRVAQERAANAGFRQLAVISAIGTRDYYRRLGFSDGELYQNKVLSNSGLELESSTGEERPL